MNVLAELERHSFLAIALPEHLFLFARYLSALALLIGQLLHLNA
jgi:hypothetical protein